MNEFYQPEKYRKVQIRTALGLARDLYKMGESTPGQFIDDRFRVIEEYGIEPGKQINSESMHVDTLERDIPKQSVEKVPAIDAEGGL